MTGVAVIGVGSAHGFDRLGWEVADRLQIRAAGLPGGDNGVRVQRCERFGAPLLAQLRGCRRAVVVDALQTGAAAGELLRFQLDEGGEVPCGLSSHGWGLAGTLQLGRALGELPPRITVLGIEVDDETTPPTAAQVEQVCRLVHEELGGSSDPPLREPPCHRPGTGRSDQR